MRALASPKLGNCSSRASRGPKRPDELLEHVAEEEDVRPLGGDTPSPLTAPRMTEAAAAAVLVRIGGRDERPADRVVHHRAFAKRPAVVRACASGLDDIDLLKEVRADVADEESAIAVDGEPEWIAQAVHPDGAACISAAGKRIVRRDRAVLVDAQNLAADVRQVGRSLIDAAVTDRDVQLAVRPEGQVDRRCESRMGRARRCYR